MSTILNSYVPEKESIKRFCRRCRCATSNTKVKTKQDEKEIDIKVCGMCKKPRLSGFCGLTHEMILQALTRR